MQLFLNKIPDKIGSCRGLCNTIHAILFFYRAAENHAACIGLNNTGYFYFNGFPNEAATVFYYDHGTVIQVRNTLILLFPVFYNGNYHFLTRQYYRFDSIGQFVDIEYDYPLQGSYFV